MKISTQFLDSVNPFHRIYAKPYEVLLSICVGFLLTYPYFGTSNVQEAVLDTILSLILLTALMTVSSHGHVRVIAWGLLVMALAGSWWPQEGSRTALHFVGLGCTAGFLFIVTYGLYRSVFAQRSVTSDTLYGAVCIYLLLGMLWSYIYILIESLLPGSFNTGLAQDAGYGKLSSELVYYSFTTLTTVGYGDVTPVTAQARSLVILQQCTGVLYVAIMMARLVSMYRGDSTVISSETAVDKEHTS